jgi:hypothetical protein
MLGGRKVNVKTVAVELKVHTSNTGPGYTVYFGGENSYVDGKDMRLAIYGPALKNLIFE